MMQTCKKHGAAFKAKMALSAIKGDRTIAELASAYGVHPNQIYAWKKQLLDGATSVFDGSVAAADGTVSEAQVDLLYRQIGQLKVENYFCHDAAVSIPLNIGNVSRAIRRVRSGPRPQATGSLALLEQGWPLQRDASSSAARMRLTLDLLWNGPKGPKFALLLLAIKPSF